MNLREFERQFGAELRSARRTETVLPITGNGLTRTQRVGVYRNNVRTVHVHALRAAYPVVSRLVGAEFFSYLADAYWADVGSVSGNIRNYGAELGQFLSTFAPVATLPYLADVARLEWLRQEARVARPIPVATDDRVFWQAGQEHGMRRIGTHPSVRLIASKYPILSIWDFCQVPDPVGELSYDAPGQMVCVSQSGRHDIVMQLLTEAEYRLLCGLVGRAERIDSLVNAATVGESSERLATLCGWARDGIVYVTDRGSA